MGYFSALAFKLGDIAVYNIARETHWSLVYHEFCDKVSGTKSKKIILGGGNYCGNGSAGITRENFVQSWESNDLQRSNETVTIWTMKYYKTELQYIISFIEPELWKSLWFDSVKKKYKEQR